MLYQQLTTPKILHLVNHIFLVKVTLQESILRDIYQQPTTKHIFPKVYEPIGLCWKGISTTLSIISKINHIFFDAL